MGSEEWLDCANCCYFSWYLGRRERRWQVLVVSTWLSSSYWPHDPFNQNLYLLSFSFPLLPDLYICNIYKILKSVWSKWKKKSKAFLRFINGTNSVNVVFIQKEWRVRICHQIFDFSNIFKSYTQTFLKVI